SQWKGRDTNYTPPAEVPVKSTPDLKTPLGEQVFALSADQFITRLNELLVNNPARPADAAMMARIGKIGVVPGAKFPVNDLSPELRAAIDSGLAEAKKAIIDHEPMMGKTVNGWSIILDAGRYGTDYLNRAAATYFFVGANLPEDAVYPSTTRDSDGHALDAAN